jgi:hypothetical protein
MTGTWWLHHARGSVSTFLSISRSAFTSIHLLLMIYSRLSYGTGRPAILKDDESIWECRHLLQHPLAIEDDMRLVSTVELMAIRERVHNNIPTEGPVDTKTFASLSQADSEFRHWYKTWDTAFSQKYEDAGRCIPGKLMSNCPYPVVQRSIGKVCKFNMSTLSYSITPPPSGA